MYHLTYNKSPAGCWLEITRTGQLVYSPTARNTNVYDASHVHLDVVRDEYHTIHFSVCRPRHPGINAIILAYYMLGLAGKRSFSC